MAFTRKWASYNSRGSMVGADSSSSSTLDRRGIQHDLSDSNLSVFTTASNSSEGEVDEEIKLLCGDDDLVEWTWADEGGDQLRVQEYGEVHHKRRRMLPKLIHRIRRKINWQLVLFLLLVLVIFTFTSQWTSYQDNTASVAGWDVNRTRDTAAYVLPDLYTATMEPRVVERHKRYLLVVVVCSAAENFDTRQAIRQTWANGSEFNYENAFHRMHRYANNYAPINPNVLLDVRHQLFDKRSLRTTVGAKEESYVSAEGREASSQTHSPLDGLHSQVIFLVGKPQLDATQALLQEEGASFGDILQENFLDTYNNLTLKSLMLLKWINNFNDGEDGHKIKFVMKCDDDTFLNLPNLVHVLLGGTVPIYEDTLKIYTENAKAIKPRVSRAPGDQALMGFLFQNAKPIRDSTSKWYAPHYMYHKKIFPNYLSGTGYVIEATHTARQLYMTALSTPLFHLEDVYITGLCAGRDSAPHHHPLFSFLRYADRKCALRGMITQHPMTTAREIRNAYETLTNDSVRCDQPPEENVEQISSSSSSGGSSLHWDELVFWLAALAAAKSNQ